MADMNEFWERLFPDSIRTDEYDDKHGTNISGRKGSGSSSHTAHDIWEARWGRGPAAGKTGDPFKDDPFFNPWAPGGKFNKGR